jgi:hypothetical protein
VLRARRAREEGVGVIASFVDVSLSSKTDKYLPKGRRVKRVNFLESVG